MSTGTRRVSVYQPRSRRAAAREAVRNLQATLAQLMTETVRRGCGVALIIATIAALAALASFHAGDPSFDHATATQPSNWLGLVGSDVADLLYRSLGLAGFVLILPLGAWGWRLSSGGRIAQGGWRFAGLVLGALFIAASLGTIHIATALPAGAGGVTGMVTDFLLAKIAASFAATHLSLIFAILFASLGFALVVMTSGLRLSSFAAVGQAYGAVTGGVTGAWDWISAFRKPRAKKKRAKPRAASASDDDDADFDDGEYDSDEDYDDEGDAVEDEDDVREPMVREGKVQARVRREERKQKPRPKPGGQPALNLSEGEYQLPPLGLLMEPPNEPHAQDVSDDALEENARLLESVLSDFGLRGRIVAVRPGPVVTLYELEPAAGVKSSRVVSLSDDIARSMSAVAARVAVIPGRNVIGIELPNLKRETVYLRDMFSVPEYEKSRAPLTLALGKTIGGEPVMADLAKMPHLLIAGTTGSGKSVAINTMILSILYRMPPEHCRFIMIDPKMLELSVYDGIPHLLAPVVIDPKKAVVALKWAVREMETRYAKMSKIGVRGVEAFNDRVRKAKEKGETLKRTVQTGFDRETGQPIYEDENLELEAMPYIVVVVDEMADLMMVSGKEIEGAVQRLAQMARAAGIHLIAATQRPSVDVITGTIKANFPTRISFQVTSKIDSRTILGEQGAEQLLGQGDMLYMMAGGRIKRVHGPFVTDTEVEDVVRYLKTQGHPSYLEAVTEEPDEDSEDAYGLYGSESAGGGDDLYDKAVAIVARERKVSTSYVQRRLQIGYNRAARLIERMEEDGMISKPNHQGKREILLPDRNED